MLEKILENKFDIVLQKICENFGIVLYYPFSLMIEPINMCNLGCPACPTGSGKMNRPKYATSYDEFKGIIDQCRCHIKNIILWNFGEPFLNKDLLKMINYAHISGMHVMTSTNGHFFKSEEFCLDIIRSGLDRLIVCLDGADQDVISKYRKNAKFDDIINGFRLLCEAKKQIGSKTPIIELQFILMKHNEHQRQYMRQLANQLGADVYTEKTVGIGPDRTDEEFQNLANELLPNDLSLSRYLKRNGVFVPKYRSNKCPDVYRTTVINSNGTVIPCCYDESSRYIMGNIFEESLNSIWRNDKYQNFRKRIRKDRKSIPLCAKCSENTCIIKIKI